MSSLRKVLLAMLLVSLTGSAFGAGTFASFTATTTNAGSTFASGTLVLANTNPTQTSCLSTGLTSTTDSNTYGCAAAFSGSLKAPGQTATGNITIENRGNLASSATYLYRAGTSCTDSDTGDSTFHGTGSMCDATQLTVQQTATSGGTASACLYGTGASGTIAAGTAITFPTTGFDASNNKFRLNWNGTGLTADITLASYPYADRTALQTAINTALTGAGLSASVDAAVGLDNKVYFASRTIGASSSILIQDGTTTNARDNLGFTAGQTNTGGQTTCTPDPIHDLNHFIANYTAAGASTGISLGALAATDGNVNTGPDAKFYTLTATFPQDAGNEYQGRQASVGFSWTIVQ